MENNHITLLPYTAPFYIEAHHSCVKLRLFFSPLIKTHNWWAWFRRLFITHTQCGVVIKGAHSSTKRSGVKAPFYHRRVLEAGHRIPRISKDVGLSLTLWPLCKEWEAMNSFSCLGGLSLKEYSLITRKRTQRGLALGMPRKGLFSTSRLSADMTSPLFKPVYPHHLLTTLKPEKMDEVKGVDSVITLSQPSLFEPAFDCLRQLLRLKARLTISQFICHVASFRHLQE